LVEGAAPDGVKFALYDENGEPVPCQISVLARWKDGSARWVLLDFQAEPSANGTASFKLSWGNREYDTARHILLQFARTGDPKCFYVGNTAARHTSEVDVIHFVNDDLKEHFISDVGGNSSYPIRPGMVHQHCVGHVSGFYSVERIRELYVSLRIDAVRSFIYIKR